MCLKAHSSLLIPGKASAIPSATEGSQLCKIPTAPESILRNCCSHKVVPHEPLLGKFSLNLLPLAVSDPKGIFQAKFFYDYSQDLLDRHISFITVS